eukprot:scaffold41444_cov57-Phaeocystis_antarctica.AAC.3
MAPALTMATWLSAAAAAQQRHERLDGTCLSDGCLVVCVPSEVAQRASRLHLRRRVAAAHSATRASKAPAWA